MNRSEDDEKDQYITKHFDFRLDGNINGEESSRQNNFAYAYFRDEIKGKVNKGEKCNPDIDIEQKWGNGSGEENQTNPSLELHANTQTKENSVCMVVMIIKLFMQENGITTIS